MNKTHILGRPACQKHLVVFTEIHKKKKVHPSFPPCVHSPYSHSLLVVVFFQVLFQSVWNGQHIDAVVGGAAADGRPAHVLQREGLRAVDGVGQQRLKEHA